MATNSLSLSNSLRPLSSSSAVFLSFQPAGLALLATAGPAKTLFSFFLCFVSAVISVVAFSHRIVFASGFTPSSTVVVRYRCSGKWWILHQLSPGLDSGAVPFLLGWWSLAFVPCRCVSSCGKGCYLRWFSGRIRTRFRCNRWMLYKIWASLC